MQPVGVDVSHSRFALPAVIVASLAWSGCELVLGYEDTVESHAAAGAGGASDTGGAAGAQQSGGADAGLDVSTGGTGGTGDAGAGGSDAATGGAAGTGGGGVPDASTGGTGGTGGGGCSSCGPLEQCYAGQFCVAKSVVVTGGYAIDATEVTRAQYASVLPVLSSAGQPPACSWNADFTPQTEDDSAGCGAGVWPPGANGSFPVVCVDWCDAYAYCQAVGKRLCGQIGGTHADFGDYADATKSQWFNVCSSGGSSLFPYPGAFNDQVCNGEGYGAGAALPVATLDGCQPTVAGFEGVYDLSGNVSEWEDSCDVADGGSGDCRVRGGSFLGDIYYLRCDSDYAYTPGFQVSAIGFRCCGP